MPNYKISFSFIWYWYIKYFSFIAPKNEKKYTFLMNFQPKFLNFQMALDSINVYQ